MLRFLSFFVALALPMISSSAFALTCTNNNDGTCTLPVDFYILGSATDVEGQWLNDNKKKQSALEHCNQLLQIYDRKESLKLSAAEGRPLADLCGRARFRSERKPLTPRKNEAAKIQERAYATVPYSAHPYEFSVLTPRDLSDEASRITSSQMVSWACHRFAAYLMSLRDIHFAGCFSEGFSNKQHAEGPFKEQHLWQVMKMLVLSAQPLTSSMIGLESLESIPLLFSRIDQGQAKDHNYLDWNTWFPTWYMDNSHLNRDGQDLLSTAILEYDLNDRWGPRLNIIPPPVLAALTEERQGGPSALEKLSNAGTHLTNTLDTMGRFFKRLQK